MGYGSDVSQVGLGGIGEFYINEKWSVSPSMLFYLSESSSTLKYNWMEFNANANYYFLSEGIANLYGLGGINYMHSSVKQKSGNEVRYSNGDVGINIGVGANFDVGKNFEPFAEMKFVFGDADQLALFFGLKFSLNK